jgi:hypothetical protein
VELLIEEIPAYTKYIQPDGTIIALILKALYGLPEAAVQWYNHISQILIKQGYGASRNDKCMFTRRNEKNNRTEVIVVYVDDILYRVSDKKSESDLINTLEKEFGKLEVQRIEDGISYIGFFIERDKSNGDILISMPKHIENLITDNDIRKVAVTPANRTLYEQDNNQPCDKREFLSKLMSVYFIANRFRYESLHSLSTLASRSKNPTMGDMQCLIRIIEYLKMTKDYKLRYRKRTSNNYKIIIKAFVDASWGIHSDMKGHTGLIIFIPFIGIITAKSWKQKSVATSSTHSELIALYDSITKVIIWINYLFKDLGYDVEPIIVYQDNLSAKYVSENKNVKSNKLKYIYIKSEYINEMVENKLIKIENVQTEDMMADGLTKVLVGKSFRKLIKFLYGIE